MLMRLAFAVATAIEPEILIIDEALSVGDGAFARKSFERIMQFKQNGATILFVPIRSTRWKLCAKGRFGLMLAPSPKMALRLK